MKSKFFVFSIFIAILIFSYRFIFFLDFQRYLSVVLTFFFFSYFWFSPVAVADKKQGRMLNIEFLRFVFCCEIIWHHTAAHLGIPSKSWLGVEFFFVLSGFFMMQNFKPEKSAFEILKKKVLRFWPVMASGILLISCISGKGRIDVILNEMLFLPSTGFAYDGVNISDWYIAVLMWATLFYLLLLKTIPEKYHNFLIGIITFTATGLFFQHSDERFTPLNYTYSIGLLRGIAGMGIGYFVYLLHKKTMNLPTYNKVFFSILEGCVFVGGLVALHIPSSQNTLVIISFAALIILFVQRRGVVSVFFEHPFFAFCGKYMLSVYLTHWVVVNVTLPRIIEKYPIVLQYKVLTIISVYLVSFIVGIITYYVVERKGFPYRLFGFKQP